MSLWKVTLICSRIGKSSQARTGLMGGMWLGLGDYEQSIAKKSLKGKKSLPEMGKVLSWQPLIHLMHHWISLSNPAMEDILIEAPTVRFFAGIDLIIDRIPDETPMKQVTFIDATLIAAHSPSA